MSKKQQNIILNYIYNLSYQLLNVVLPVVITPYISRTLRADAIGAYSYTHSVVTYFSLLGILGLNMYGQMQIAKVRDDQYKLSEQFWGIFIAKAISSSITIIVFVILILNTEKYKYLYITFLILLISNIFDISWLFHGLEEFKKIVFRNYVIKLVSLLLIFAVVKSEKDVIWYSVIIQGATLGGNISLWFSVKKYIVKIETRNIEVLIHLRKSLIYFLPTIMSSVYTTMDRVMLGLFLESDFENGIYEQAHKIEHTLVTIVTSLSTVLLPRMSYLYNRNENEQYKKYLSKTLSVTGLISIPMVFGVLGISDIFVPVFLGNEFSACIHLLRIFSVLIFLSGINNIIGNQCLVAQGKQNKYNLGVILGAVSNVVLNMILIPRARANGAALATIIAEMVIFIVFVYNSRTYISLYKLIKVWYKEVVASIIMGILVWMIGSSGEISIKTLAFQIICGILSYGLLLLLMRDEQLSILLVTLRNKYIKKKRIRS